MNAYTGLAYTDSNRIAVAVACALLLALVAVIIDAVTWIELDVAAIYGLPLVLAVRARSWLILWALASGLIVATFGVYTAQIPVGAFAATETFFVNRVFDAVAVVLTAALLHVWMRSLSMLESQSRLLAERNAELLRHQQQIARQNVELDRRRIEADEASARKTRLLAAASHDIRTPVNTISIMAEVIRRAAENPAHVVQVQQLSARLQTNVRALIKLVSAVLDTAHFESGHVAYHESEFSLNELLVSICHDFLPVAQVKCIRLQAEVCEEMLWIRTDRVKLHRVMSNLISNAIKFTEAGEITVSAARSADRSLLIAVSDTGIGMGSPELACVFDEFVQLGSLGQNVHRGWGLGLAICRRFVNLMGGTITVKSDLNKGSVFTVHLPAQCLMHTPEAVPPVSSGNVCQVLPLMKRSTRG